MASKKSLIKSKALPRIMVYLSMILLLIGGYFFAWQKIYASSFYPRVYCSSELKLEGLSWEEGESLLKILVKKMQKQGFFFKASTDLGQKEILLKSELIGLTDPDLSRRLVSFDVNKTIKNAFEIGRQDKIWGRIKDMVVSFFQDREVELVVEIDKEEMIQSLKKTFSEIEKPPQQTQISVVNGELVLTSEEAGFILDYQTALQELETNLKNFKNQEIIIPVILKEPEIKFSESENAFKKAKELIALAPYSLVYKDNQWELPAEKIISWFELQKGGLRRVYLGFNREKIHQFLQEIALEINLEPVEPRLKIEDGRAVEFQVAADGLILNQEKTSQLIAQALLNNQQEIDLIVDKINPTPLPQDFDSLGIKELVGVGDSNFSGSPSNRRHNIRIGAEKLNGLLIKPDEEFSLVEAIGKINKETGFLPELVIKGDRTVPEYGGGLCQIGTTMFRLAINAGLPVTERAPHSYRVVYYEPAGTDATIYIPHPDLRLVNDTGHHLLLQTEIQRDDLIFRFYGTSDGRKVVTSPPQIYNITDPGPPQYIETTEIPPGTRKKIESSHKGADAKFKNTITFPNGIVREEIWQSHYSPWPEVWWVGIEEESEETIAEEKKLEEEEEIN